MRIGITKEGQIIEFAIIDMDFENFVSSGPSSSSNTNRMTFTKEQISKLRDELNRIEEIKSDN